MMNRMKITNEKAVRSGSPRAPPVSAVYDGSWRQSIIDQNEKAGVIFMKKVLRSNEAGFTLMEMLVTVLILGVLAAAGGGVYLGYVKDAKTAEAKATLGAMWTALQGCAQTKPGTACTVDGQEGRVGLDAAGLTADGRWTVAGGGGGLTMAADTGILTLGGAVTATGQKADNDGIIVSFSYSNAGTPPGSFTCTLPPGSAAAC
jgi:prepilin-type N-terminal cleavage/methylation domain-containing protein